VLGVLTAPLLLAGVVVLGEGRDGCPDAGAVRARLEELLGDDGSSGGPPDALIFDGEAGALRVRLLSAEGSVREEKTLDLRGSCDELADAVAALGVAWRSRLQSHDVPPPVLRVSEVAPPPARLPFQPAPPPAPDFELSLGLQTASGLERWAPSVLLGAQMPLSGSYNFGLTLDVSAPRSAVDSTTRWVWMEVRVVAGPSVRVASKNVYVDAKLGLGAGIDVTLNDRGAGASQLHRASPALVIGGRWTYRRSSSMPWFGLTNTIYLDPNLDSPVRNTNILAERWVLGLALGAAVPFAAGH